MSVRAVLVKFNWGEKMHLDGKGPFCGLGSLIEYKAEIEQHSLFHVSLFFDYRDNGTCSLKLLGPHLPCHCRIHPTTVNLLPSLHFP